MSLFDRDGTPIGLHNPCKECNMRYVGCHSKCDYYITFKEALEEIRKKKNKYREVDNLLSANFRGNHRVHHVSPVYRQKRGG